MNSPLTKYAPKELVFFNYHEYLVEDYEPVSGPCARDHAARSPEPPALVINHFPNPYITRDSELFSKTRIVRIPRIFDTCDDLYLVPQFSPYYPGKEPGAIVSASETLLEGRYMGQYFGFESRSPLLQWLKEVELSDIISTINKLLLDAYSPENKLGALENALDFFTATLYSGLYLNLVHMSRQERLVAEVDKYIDLVNREVLSKKHHLLMLVPVTTSAMLSLDFQIPAPVQSDGDFP